MESVNQLSGSLILPRVNVEWGTVNLTCPEAEGSVLKDVNLKGIGPLVYDVRMSMEDQGQTPTGSMKWNPSAPAYAIYEKCIELFSEWSIMVTFYYVTGKSITFEFFWGGQAEVYGKEMEITVKLVTLMDGLINANFYATVQADKEEKGKNYKDSLAELFKQYGLNGVLLGPDRPDRPPFIRYTKKAEKDLSDAIVKMNYNDGSTFMDAMQNLVKDNGNNVFFNNINTANALIYGPYSYECLDLTSGKDASGMTAAERGETLLEIPNYKTRKSPDPKVRYAHFIGPGIIQSLTRTMEWQPPQKSQEINAILARKVEEKKQQQQQQRRRNTPQSSQAASSSSATAPSGVYGSKNSANIRSEKNSMGPIKQDIFTKERASKLSLTTLMCPSLVGIKPLDILLIPSYSGSYIEDWIVSSVEYQQTAGGVDLAIQATRVYGSSEPMCPPDLDRILDLMKTPEIGGGIILPDGGTPELESWMRYAWTKFLNIPNDMPAPVSTPSPTAEPAPSPDPSQTGQTGQTGDAPPPSQTQPLTYEYVEQVNREYPLLPPDKALTVFAEIPGKGPIVQSNDPVFTNWMDLTVRATPASNLKQPVIVSPGVNGKGKIEGASLTELRQVYEKVYANPQDYRSRYYFMDVLVK